MSTLAIDVRDVSFTYPTARNRAPALRNVSLCVKRGEIFGLLGPNGAGKSTLLSCIQALISADSGAVQVEGIDVRAQPAQVKQQLGIQMQRTALFEELNARELIALYAALYDVHLDRTQIEALLTRMDLSDLGGKTAKRMSGGQQQRLSLALAIANDPKIVLLDEPTESLDPHARRLIWDLLRALRAEGRTVLLTTHQMDEAESLCDRVAIIDSGAIVACDSPANLINTLGMTSTLRVSIDVPLDDVRALTGVRSAQLSGAHIDIDSSAPQRTLAALYELAQQRGRSINNVALRQPNLEDVYLKLTGQPLS